MGAKACGEAARCRVEEVTAPTSQSSELFSKCATGRLPIQLPIPEDDLLDCVCEKVEESDELRELTFVMENRDMPKTLVEEQRGDLSHRSCASDLERQVEFSEHKQKVEQRRAERSTVKGPSKASQVAELQEQYRSLGINVGPCNMRRNHALRHAACAAFANKKVMSAEEVTIEFEVIAYTHLGQWVCVVGSTEQLGGWTPTHASALATDVCLAEFKFLKLDSHGAAWEDGNNRYFAVADKGVVTRSGEPGEPTTATFGTQDPSSVPRLVTGKDDAVMKVKEPRRSNSLSLLPETGLVAEHWGRCRDLSGAAGTFQVLP
eukprot:s1853_g10.t2